MDLGGEMETGLPVQMPSLEHSAKVFLRASQLEQRVSDHMHGVDVRVTEHKILEIKRQASPEIRQAVALVRNRQSQRAAIIAGIILGPPKAMDYSPKQHVASTLRSRRGIFSEGRASATAAGA